MASKNRVARQDYLLHQFPKLRGPALWPGRVLINELVGDYLRLRERIVDDAAKEIICMPDAEPGRFVWHQRIVGDEKHIAAVKMLPLVESRKFILLDRGDGLPDRRKRRLL